MALKIEPLETTRQRVSLEVIAASRRTLSYRAATGRRSCRAHSSREPIGELRRSVREVICFSGVFSVIGLCRPSSRPCRPDRVVPTVSSLSSSSSFPESRGVGNRNAIPTVVKSNRRHWRYDPLSRLYVSQFFANPVSFEAFRRSPMLALEGGRESAPTGPVFEEFRRVQKNVWGTPWAREAYLRSSICSLAPSIAVPMSNGRRSPLRRRRNVETLAKRVLSAPS